jgi:hypothetical protein
MWPRHLSLAAAAKSGAAHRGRSPGLPEPRGRESAPVTQPISQEAFPTAGTAPNDTLTFIPRGPAAPVPPNRPCTIGMVGCIESGTLEPQTIRAIESLRLFGGRFSRCDVVLVQPRPGAPLMDSTRARLRELGAVILDVPYLRHYRWQHFMNKLHAMLWAERTLTTDVVAWIDGDLIFLDEPVELELTSDEDVVGQPEMGIVGTTGPEDEHEAYWARTANLFGLRVEELPWVRAVGGERIRLYLNAGHFAFRRTCRFAEDYYADCDKFLRSGVAKHHTEVHFMDQVVLSMTIMRRQLAWRAMTLAGNYHTTLVEFSRFVDPERLRGATVLHYHDTMYPETWDEMLQCLEQTHPRIADWLRPQGPIVAPGGFGRHAVREAYRIARGVHRRVFYRIHGIYKPPKRPNLKA